MHVTIGLVRGKVHDLSREGCSGGFEINPKILIDKRLAGRSRNPADGTLCLLGCHAPRKTLFTAGARLAGRHTRVRCRHCGIDVDRALRPVDSFVPH